ncbi:MAG TPA: hypothetical protein VJ842_10725 [Pyrinomonadaceae bacterium]|nr:hypothetical protein [Pyrinomonadaceae bacterium]
MLDKLTFYKDSSFWIGISSNIAYGLILFFLRHSAKIFKKATVRRSKLSKVFPFLALLMWVALNISFYIYIPKYALTLIIITSLLLAYYVWRELTQFWAGGILRYEKSITQGLGFDSSLELCTNHLDFLGIGASKLTASSEFERAIRRCNDPERAVRFLLSKPSNPLLDEAAERFGVNPNDYKAKVENSLRKISQLKLNNHLNIEVRFYPNANVSDTPLFRLMFINNSICLVSYYVLGEDDGSNAPQLVLKHFEDQRATESYFYPFRLYFDNLWKNAQPWDFKFPII